MFLRNIFALWRSGLTSTNNILCQVCNWIPSSDVTCMLDTSKSGHENRLLSATIPEISESAAENWGHFRLCLDGIWGLHTTFASEWWHQMYGQLRIWLCKVVKLWACTISVLHLQNFQSLLWTTKDAKHMSFSCVTNTYIFTSLHFTSPQPRWYSHPLWIYHELHQTITNSIA